MKTSTKIYVGNIPPDCQNEELQNLFDKYGKVLECDVIRNYGFVHMESEEEAQVAIKNLNNFELRGTKISVEQSRSRVRTKPGMGGTGQCYRCGRQGHWSKECPKNPPSRGRGMPMRGERPMRGGGYFEGRMGPYPSERGFGMERPYGREPGFGPDRGYGDRMYGMDRFAERSYPPERGYMAAERMRPYPEPYERRQAPAPPAEREDYYGGYYRRAPAAYDDFSYGSRRTPPVGGRMMGSADGYDYTEDRTAWDSVGAARDGAQMGSMGSSMGMAAGGGFGRTAGYM